MPTLQEIESAKVFEQYAARKRACFVADYQLEDKPALIWQVWPTATVRIDTSDMQLVGTLMSGSRESMEEGYWHGFRGSQACRVFEGVASHRREDIRGSVTEIHEDGHVVTGLWSFPESGSVTGIGEFFEHAFIDALEVAIALLKSGGCAGEAAATCTLVHADRTVMLHDVGKPVGRQPTRGAFHWPLARVSPDTVEAVGVAMATQFLGIYGRKRRT